MDSKNSEAIIELIKELHSAGSTIVVITHDIEIANSFPRVIAMRDGQVEKDSLSQVYL